MLKNLKNNKYKFALALASVSSLSAPVFADGETTVSDVTSSLVSALTSAKSDFMTAVGSIVTVAVGFFIVKLVVTQGINFFSSIAKK